MQIWLDQTQSGRVKLHVKFVDVAGSDAKLLLELRRPVVDDHADVVVVGVPVFLDDSFGQAAQVASIPVLLTLPTAEPMTSPGGRFTFALAPTPEAIARLLLKDVIDRGLLAPMLLASDDSAVAVRERAAFQAELARRGLAGPASVPLAQPDGPQRVRAAAAVAKSVVLTGASAPYGDLIRELPATLAAPVYLSYLTETADVTNLRDQSVIVTWPGSRALAPFPATPTSAARTFLKLFDDRHGPPSTLAGSAYDALGMIAAAAELAPTELDGARLRLRLEASTFDGVVTEYSFLPSRHAGFAADDLAYLRWNAALGVPVRAQ